MPAPRSYTISLHDPLSFAPVQPAKQSDKLVACAAVAEHFHQILQSDYLAGLSREMLLSNLLWRRRLWEASIHRPAGGAYRAPSWSWVAVDGEVYWYDRCLSGADQDAGAVAKVVDCNTTPEHATLPFGRVTDGALILRAALFQCRLQRSQDERNAPAGEYQIVLQSFQRPGHQRKCDGLEGIDELNEEMKLIGDAAIDYDAHDGQIERLWAIPLLTLPSDKPGEPESVSGLIVALAESHGSESNCGELLYRRVGYFCELRYRGEPRDEEAQESERLKTASHELMQALNRKLKAEEYPLVNIMLV